MTRTRLLTALLSAGGICLAASGAPAMAAPPSGQPVLRYACPEDGLPDPEALCDALRDALREAAPAHRLLRQNGADPAPAPGELSLVLRLDRASARGMAAHLLWQGSDDSAPHKGPMAEFSVMDTALTPRMYPRFIRALVAASDLPI